MIIGLYSFEPSEWNSCKTIVSNLVQSYQECLKDQPHLFFDFSRKQTESELVKMAEEILRLKPKTLIFMDHQPHPANLLSIMLPRMNYPLEIIFHVYGDFLLPYPSHWLKLDKYLKKCQVKFVCASHKQARFIQQFLGQPKINFVSPFPINPSEFDYSDAIRKKTREFYNISDDSFCWIYTGRMSQQKNLIPLIKSFAHYKEKTKCNDQLILLGKFDNVGLPFLNIYQSDNEYFYHFNLALKNLPLKIQQDIRYLGSCSTNLMNHYYNMADAFISLSTHNDEDYGMSVAEAMSTGLPCLLSLWGGFASFPKYAAKDQSMELIRLFMKGGKFHYSEDGLTKKMMKLRQSRLDRKNAADHVHQTIGVKAVASRLTRILEAKPQRYIGFSANLLSLSMLWHEGNFPFTDDSIHFNLYYKKLYEPYYN